MTKNSNLNDAIQNLAKKKDVLTTESLIAKDNLESVKEIQDISKLTKNSIPLIEEFNSNVHMLSTIFRESNFDDLVLFISHPGRVFIINFFIGIVRGLGFIIGIFILLSLLAVLTNTFGPATVIETLLRLLNKN